MPRYDELRTLAFRVAPEVTTLPQTYAQLSFPESWKDVLIHAQAELSGRNPDKTSLPIRSLNQTLRALVPDLISINPYGGRRGERSWLYAATPIDPQALYIIAHAWVRTLFAKASDGSRRDLLKQLRPNDMQWHVTPIDLAVWAKAPNGTAEPRISENRQAPFIMLPDFLAAKLSTATLEFGPEPLRFRRAPLAPGAPGAELISWPPRWYEDKRQRWPWSVVLTLTVQTVPFQSYPVIHCDIGIRRWAGPKVYLPGGETSVYLLTSVPWIQGLHYSNSFQVAPIRWTRQVQVNPAHDQDKPLFSPAWGSHLAPVLDILQPQQALPEPAQLVEDPAVGLNLNSSPSAAIVYRAGMKPEHGVGPGLMPADRRTLIEQIATLLSPTIVFTDAPTKASTHASRPTNVFASNADDPPTGEQQARYREQIGTAVGRRLTIEIWYQTTAVKQTLAKVISNYVGMVEPTTFPITYSTPELILTVDAHPLGSIGEALAPDYYQGNPRDRLHAAIHQRAQHITERISTATGATAALIELDHKDAFSGDTDPKHAIRFGFASAKRLTQFIDTKDDDSLGIRATKAVLDLLRQLGVQSAAPQIRLKDYILPNPVHYVGLWLIKQFAPSSATRMQHMLPVLVHLASDGTTIRALAPGFTEWLPYSEALINIACGRARGFIRPREAMPFIRQTLQRDLQGDTLLLCHAQNLRQAWPWLNNGKITQDKLAFGDEPLQPIREWPGLRIVRVRDNSSSETPEWYAQKDDDQGFSGELFRISNRVFASTSRKPNQFKKLSRNLSKATSWTSMSGKTFPPAPEVHAWNPSLVELTVAGLQPQDHEKAWPWAALAHELRRMSLQYDEATTLPVPLHLAELMEEYVLPLGNFDEEE